MNKLKTSEITNLQMLVSVIQNTNFSWAQFVQHSKALYRVFCDQHHYCCMSQVILSRTWPVPRALLTALTACGCPQPRWPFIMLRAISVCLLPPLAIYPPTTFSLVRRSEKRRRHLPRQLLQTVHRRFTKCSIVMSSFTFPPIYCCMKQ